MRVAPTSFQVREAVEGYGARLAAENIDRADYAVRLVACREALNDPDASIQKQTDEKQHFHDLLYEIAGNSVLKDVATRLTFPINRVIFNEMTAKVRAKQSLAEHNDIIDAILAGDGVRAERLMRSHLHNGAIAVCEILGQSAYRRSLRRKDEGKVDAE